MARSIIIDTDPGHDDAFAILAAIASPEIDVRAITTVAGNVSVDKTTYNALRLRDLAGAAEIPIYRGCSRPMVNDLVTAEYVHGESGLDGPDLPAPTRSVEPGQAVDYLIDVLTTPELPVSICVLGPMTNLGHALDREPAIAANIAELVIMGGSFHAGGNVTPAAEFNVYVDPHAAEIVLGSEVPVTMMPLDVTHQAQATPARIASFREIDSPVGDALAAMLDFAGEYDVAEFGFEGYPLHDPTVIAYLIEPEMFELRRCDISVVTDLGPDHGRTIADWSDHAAASVAMGIDADRYFALLTELVSTL